MKKVVRKHKMKKVRLYITCLAIIFLFTCISSLSSAEKNTMDKPEWEVGDSWILDGTVYSEDQEYSGTLAYNIVEKTDINIKGSIYEVFKVEMNGPFENWVYYYDAETMEMLKNTRNTNIPGENDWDVTYTNFTNFWPIYVNKTVNWTTEIIKKYYWGYANETVNYSKKCTSMVDIETPEGKFKCFEVKKYVDGSIESINYWSQDCEFIIRHMYYNRGGDIIRESTLKSLSYSENQTKEEKPKNQNNEITTFLVAVFLILITISILIVYKIYQGKKS